MDDEDCLAYFHRWRMIRLLQEIRDEVGSETFEQIWLHFGSIRSAGFSLEEIVQTDKSVLIDREPYAEDSEESVEASEEDSVEEMHD